MAVSMYPISLPVFVRRLNGLATCLKKAQALYTEKKYDESTLLSYRLFPDMFTLVRQIQQATDHAKNFAALLSGASAPSFEGNEKSLADLIGRVQKTIDFLSSIKAEQIDGTEGKSVTVKAGDRELQFTGIELLLNRTLPNFYFHYTTAYNILRHNGVEIGKRDFMGS